MAASPAIKATETARRYARALFELVQDKGALSDTHRDLASFKEMAADSSDLTTLLASPAFSRDDKSAALSSIASKAGLNSWVSKFLGTMAANGRSTDVLGAVAAFDELYAKQRGVKRAIVTTAKPMTSDQHSRIEGILAKAVGGDVELSAEVDPALVGGIQLRIGSKLVDASVASKLDRMNTAMKGA